MQQLLEKLSSLKTRTDDIDTRMSKFEKETDSKLNSIKGAITVIESMASKIDKISLNAENELKSVQERTKAAELKIERKIEQYESGVEKFEKWMKDVEAKNTKDEKQRDKLLSETIERIVKEADNNKKELKELGLELKDKHSKLEKWLEKADKQNQGSFEEKTKKLNTLALEIEEVKRDIDAKDKLVQKTLLKTATDKEMDELKAEIEKMNKILKTLGSKEDVDEVKKAALGIDKVIEASLSDIRKEFDEIKKKMRDFAEVEKVIKSVAEMKMDVASTEAGIKRTVDELSQRFDMMKDEVGYSSEFKQLSDQDIILKERIIELERRFNSDLNKSLNEIEKLGDIFANKQELTMTMSEVSSEVTRLREEVNKLDIKHTELDKQIVVREDLKDKGTRERAEEALTNVYSILDEFNSQKQMSEVLQQEFIILKNQIITTQNALVELNRSMQRTNFNSGY